VQVVRHALTWPEDAQPGALDDALDAPLLFDRSRDSLPVSADLIEQRAPLPQ
jgi:hypothetical protein